ncbi:MAG: WXG100 family type VII secretion target [Thermoleophilaceae bacterium]
MTFAYRKRQGGIHPYGSQRIHSRHPGAARSDRRAAQRGAANIEQINQQLQGQVAPLGSDWAGVAQARFHELWAEWQRSSQGIQHALQGISQLMTQASANYADTEQAIASSFQR